MLRYFRLRQVGQVMSDQVSLIHVRSVNFRLDDVRSGYLMLFQFSTI